jgi:hypothetical protein
MDRERLRRLAVIFSIGGVIGLAVSLTVRGIYSWHKQMASADMMAKAQAELDDINSRERCIDSAVKLGRVKGFTRDCRRVLESQLYELVLRPGDPIKRMDGIRYDFGMTIEEIAEERSVALANPSMFWSPAVIDGWNLQYLERAERELNDMMRKGTP